MHQRGYDLARVKLQDIRIGGEEINPDIIDLIASLSTEADHVNAHAIGILGIVVEMAQTNDVAEFNQVLVKLDTKVHTNHLSSDPQPIWIETSSFTKAHAADTSPNHSLWKTIIAQSIDEALKPRS